MALSASSSSLASSLRTFLSIKSPPGGTSEDASVPAADDDTHADFRPAYAPPPTPESVHSSIERDVATHEVFVYMKVRIFQFLLFLSPLSLFSFLFFSLPQPQHSSLPTTSTLRKKKKNAIGGP